MGPHTSVWKDKELVLSAVRENVSLSGVLRSLGLPATGGHWHTLRKYLALYSADTSHFTGQAHNRGKTFPGLKGVPLDEVLVVGRWFSRSALKVKLLKAKLLVAECAFCKISEWQGSKLSLHLDHINGIPNDNRLENLRLLCPNCHSQTDTYCGRNKKTKYPKIVRPSKQPIAQLREPKPKKPPADPNWRHNPRPGARKVVRPSAAELSKLVWEQPTSAVALKFGVCDNAIGKWCREAGVKKPPRGYWTKALGYKPPVTPRTAKCGSYTMYVSHGCRCDLCIEEFRRCNRENKRAYRARKKNNGHVDQLAGVSTLKA